MSYDVAERSNYGGKPVVLYEFNFGTTHWFLTTDEMEVVFGGDTYLPIPISDSGYMQSGESQIDDVRIRMPAQHQIVDLFSPMPPIESLWVTIRRMNRGEPEAPIYFVGYVASVKGIREAELLCKPISNSFVRNGLRMSWSKQCQHALYDSQCRVNKLDFRESATVTSLTGTDVHAAIFDTFDDGYFDNGFIEYMLDLGAWERKGIESHVGDRVRLLGVTSGITEGMSLYAYPGCSRTTSTCLAKFNNLSNYGGFPHLPGKSPFDGDPVF